MKRDMDLIRELMLKLESVEIQPGMVFFFNPDDPAVFVEGRSLDEIDYHLKLMQKSYSGNWVMAG